MLAPELPILPVVGDDWSVGKERGGWAAMTNDWPHRLHARPLEARGRARRLACLLVLAGAILALAGCVQYAVENVRVPDEHPRAIVTADFDRDGVTDALVGYETATYAGVSLIRQDGFGFWEHHGPDPLALVGEMMVVTDTHGDGTSDVVSAASGFNQIQLLRNADDGTGRLEFADLKAVTGNVTALAAGSAGDVRLVAVAHETIGIRYVTIFHAADGTLMQRFQWSRMGDSASELALHDVTGDGWLDLVVGTADGKVEIYAGATADGVLVNIPTVLTASGHSAAVVALAVGDIATPFHPDLNAREWRVDGHPDILAAFNDGDAVVAWRGTGRGGFATGVDVMDRAATGARLVSLQIDPQGSGAWGGLVRSDPGNASSKPKVYAGNDREFALFTMDVVCDAIDAAPVPMGAGAIVAGTAMVCSDGQVKVALPMVKRLRVSPKRFDFGSQRVGTTSAERAPEVFELPDDVVITTSVLDGPDAVDFRLRESCSPSGRCVPYVAFAPRSRGVKQARVRIMGSYYTPGGRGHEIELTGTAIGPVASAPAAVDVGEVEVGATARATFSVRNDGDVPLNVEEVSFAGPALGWTAELGTCDGPVEPGDSCEAVVRFAPSVAGESSATVRVVSDSVEEEPTIVVSGNGVNPPSGGDDEGEEEPGDGEGDKQPGGGGDGEQPGEGGVDPAPRPGGGGNGGGSDGGGRPAGGGGDRGVSPSRRQAAVRARAQVVVGRGGRGRAVVRVVARNLGRRVARRVTLRLRLPRGVRVVRSRLGGVSVRQRGNLVIVRITRVAPGRARVVPLRVRGGTRLSRRGPRVTVAASAASTTATRAP